MLSQRTLVAPLGEKEERYLERKKESQEDRCALEKLRAHYTGVFQFTGCEILKVYMLNN